MEKWIVKHRKLVFLLSLVIIIFIGIAMVWFFRWWISSAIIFAFIAIQALLFGFKVLYARNVNIK